MHGRAALLLSTAAFLVALLGWTPIGEAAREAVFPRNSVGTVQLKSGAVTSPKIRNGTIARVDLARSARIAGPRGPAGAPGAKGDRGEAGPRGPSDLFARRGTVVNLTSAFSELVKLTLPAGRYLIEANVVVANPSATASVAVLCTMTLGPVTLATVARLDPRGGTNVATHQIVHWQNLASGGEVELECRVQTGSTGYTGTEAQVLSPTLTALRVETIS